MKTDYVRVAIRNMKCEILDEIRKVLPNGIHYYTKPFCIHYIDGDVATTEICKAIEVVAESQMVKIHHQSYGYGEDDIDITDGEEIFGYEPNSLADILGNLKADIRDEKLSVLRNLVKENGGRMNFDGSFRYVGYDPEVCIDDCEDTMLMGFGLNYEGKLLVDNIWQGDEYRNTEDYLTDSELDRIIDYVQNQVNQKTWNIKAVAIKTFDICAPDYETALNLAKKEYGDNPINSGDIKWY